MRKIQNLIVYIIVLFAAIGFFQEANSETIKEKTHVVIDKSNQNATSDIKENTNSVPALTITDCDYPKNLSQQNYCAPLIANLISKKSLGYSKLNLIVTALGTLFSVSGLYFLWITIHNAEKSFKIENRAYIKHELIRADIKVGQPISLQWKVINYGKTQATKVKNANSFAIEESNWWWDNVEDEKYQNPEMGKELNGTIHPSDSCFLFEVYDRLIITKEIEEYLQKEQSVVYFRFLTIYSDVFGGRHEIRTYLEFSGPICYEKKMPRFSKLNVEVKEL